MAEPDDVLAPLVAAAVLACACAQAVIVLFHAPDVVELRIGFVRTLVNVTRGSLNVVQVRLGTAPVLTRSRPTFSPAIPPRRAAGPRRLWVHATAVATAAFSPTLAALNFA